MENDEFPTKIKWYSIQEAAEYLDVGEPTLYRWMREGKITYRKVGDSTRFWQGDLDAVMQVYHGAKDLEKAREVCPICHHDELMEGRVQSTGLNHFCPKKTRFWILKSATIATTAKMCVQCGAIVWFGDAGKLVALRARAATPEAAKEATIPTHKETK